MRLVVVFLWACISTAVALAQPADNERLGFPHTQEVYFEGNLGPLGKFDVAMHLQCDGPIMADSIHVRGIYLHRPDGTERTLDGWMHPSGPETYKLRLVEFEKRKKEYATFDGYLGRNREGRLTFDGIWNLKDSKEKLVFRLTESLVCRVWQQKLFNEVYVNWRSVEVEEGCYKFISSYPEVSAPNTDFQLEKANAELTVNGGLPMAYDTVRADYWANQTGNCPPKHCQQDQQNPRGAYSMWSTCQAGDFVFSRLEFHEMLYEMHAVANRFVVYRYHGVEQYYGARSQNWFESSGNYDLVTGQRLTLPMLFDSTSNYLQVLADSGYKALSPLIFQSGGVRNESKYELTEERLRAALTPEVASFADFQLVEAGLLIRIPYYRLHRIPVYQADEDFIVSWKALKPVLSSLGKEMLRD